MIIIDWHFSYDRHIFWDYRWQRSSCVLFIKNKISTCSEFYKTSEYSSKWSSFISIYNVSKSRRWMYDSIFSSFKIRIVKLLLLPQIFVFSKFKSNPLIRNNNVWICYLIVCSLLLINTNKKIGIQKRYAYHFLYI